MLFWLYAAIALLASVLASYYDIRSRTIPREITYGTLGLAFALHFFESGLAGNPASFLSSLLSAAITFTVLYIAWFFGLIAGGDVKLLTAISALLPVARNTFPWINRWHLVFLPVLWNGIILISPILFVVLLRRLGSPGKLIWKTAVESVGYAFLVYSVLSYYSGITAIALLFVLSFLPYKWLLLLLPGVFSAFRFGWSGLLASFVYIFVISLFFNVMLKSRGLFTKTISVSDLKPGDILAGVVSYKRQKGQAELKKSLLPRASGITEEEIRALERAGVSKVKVQAAVPFTPIILLGVLSLVFVGDLIWLGVKLL